MTAYQLLKYSLFTVIFIASLIVIEDRFMERYGEFFAVLDQGYYDADMTSEEGIMDPSCEIAGVILQGTLATYELPELLLDGDLMTSSENLMYQLEVAQDTPHIKAILLEIDSFGGSPVAAQEVVDTLTQYVDKPVVAHIRNGGLSAAYWVAAATDHISATRYSDVGSIGVTMSYVDEGAYNEQNGLTFNEISSGRFKDSGSAGKVLTEEEKALFQRDVDILYEGFVDEIARLRGLDREMVVAMADGSSMLGEMALEKGLIDSVGSFYDALALIEAEYGATGPICWQ